MSRYSVLALDCHYLAPGRTRIGEHDGSHASLVGSCGATVSDDSTVCRACTMTTISLAWRDWVE